MLGAWLGAILAIGPALAGRRMIWLYLFVGVMSAILIAICFMKGEPPRWRWDGK